MALVTLKSVLASICGSGESQGCDTGSLACVSSYWQPWSISIMMTMMKFIFACSCISLLFGTTAHILHRVYWHKFKRYFAQVVCQHQGHLEPSSLPAVRQRHGKEGVCVMQESGRPAGSVPTDLGESAAPYDEQAMGMLSASAGGARSQTPPQTPAAKGYTPAPLLSRELKGSVSPPPPRAPEPDR